jgi:hypothetical protein
MKHRRSRGRPRDLRKHKPSRGCSRQRTKKYRIRSSPPYPANLCRGRKMKGNDGRFYKSSRTRQAKGVYYRWMKM